MLTNVASVKQIDPNIANKLQAQLSLFSAAYAVTLHCTAATFSYSLYYTDLKQVIMIHI